MILLSTTAIQLLQSSDGSSWAPIVFPLLFACGMILVDTLDGISMLFAYLYAVADPRARRTFNLAITGGSLLAALAVGILQIFNLADQIADPQGESGFWDGIDGIRMEVLGAAVVGGLLLLVAVAAVSYSWGSRVRRRRMEEKEAGEIRNCDKAEPR